MSSGNKSKWSGIISGQAQEEVRLFQRALPFDGKESWWGGCELCFRDKILDAPPFPHHGFCRECHEDGAVAYWIDRRVKNGEYSTDPLDQKTPAHVRELIVGGILERNPRAYVGE